jgi:hypothetical protein
MGSSAQDIGGIAEGLTRGFMAGRQLRQADRRLDLVGEQLESDKRNNANNLALNQLKVTREAYNDLSKTRLENLKFNETKRINDITVAKDQRISDNRQKLQLENESKNAFQKWLRLNELNAQTINKPDTPDNIIKRHEMDAIQRSLAPLLKNESISLVVGDSGYMPMYIDPETGTTTILQPADIKQMMKDNENEILGLERDLKIDGVDLENKPSVTEVPNGIIVTGDNGIPVHYPLPDNIETSDLVWQRDAAGQSLPFVKVMRGGQLIRLVKLDESSFPEIDPDLQSDDEMEDLFFNSGQNYIPKQQNTPSAPLNGTSLQGSGGSIY